MRVLKAVLGILLALVLGVGVFLYVGKRRAEARLGELFAAAASEPLPALAGRVHPSLASEADPLQLARVLRGLVAARGAFQGLALSGLSVREHANLGGSTQLAEGTFVFERGAVPMEVGMRDGQLVHLGIREDALSRKLAEEVSRAPVDPAPYKDRGRDFWARALDGEASRAFGMLYPELREQFGQARFLEQMEGLAAQSGGLEAVEFLGARPDAHPAKLHLIYRVTLGSGATRAHVTLQFTGTASPLVAFALPSTLEPQEVAS